MIEPKFYRTLIRVVELSKDHVYVVIPAWDRFVIAIRRKSIPDFIQEKLIVGARFHARVTIGVDQACYLQFKDWELS
jgi:hypothetical protein